VRPTPGVHFGFGGGGERAQKPLEIRELPGVGALHPASRARTDGHWIRVARCERQRMPLPRQNIAGWRFPCRRKVDGPFGSAGEELVRRRAAHHHVVAFHGRKESEAEHLSGCAHHAEQLEALRGCRLLYLDWIAVVEMSPGRSLIELLRGGCECAQPIGRDARFVQSWRNFAAHLARHRFQERVEVREFAGQFHCRVESFERARERGGELFVAHAQTARTIAGELRRPGHLDEHLQQRGFVDGVLVFRHAEVR
jgi:hypothetical protein